MYYMASYGCTNQSMWKHFKFLEVHCLVYRKSKSFWSPCLLLNKHNHLGNFDLGKEYVPPCFRRLYHYRRDYLRRGGGGSVRGVLGWFRTRHYRGNHHAGRRRAGPPRLDGQGEVTRTRYRSNSPQWLLLLTVHNRCEEIGYRWKLQSEPLGDFFGNIFRKLRKWPSCYDWWKFVEIRISHIAFKLVFLVSTVFCDGTCETLSFTCCSNSKRTTRVTYCCGEWTALVMRINVNITMCIL